MKKPYKLWLKLVLNAFKVFPLQNKVFFDNMNGRGFGDDPKYIALAILKKDKKVKLLWNLNKGVSPKDLPEGIEPVVHNSLSYFYHVMTSRVWVDNQRSQFNNIPKRKGQYYIQTWHSTLGLKKLGTDNDKSSPVARSFAQYDASLTDLMYSNSDFRVNKYKTTFWYNGIVEKRDIPRVAFLMNPPTDTKQKVSKSLGFDVDKKIIMYAPTFRDNGNTDAYKLDFHRIVDAVEKLTGEKYVMIVRLHPNISRKYANLLEYDDTIINGSPYQDMPELLSVTDVLLNDFSASMFDFCLLRKPVFLIAKDYQDYLQNNRDVYFSMEELPFSFANNEDELIKNITSFNEETYKKNVDSFFDKIGMVENGHGDVELADLILSKMTI